MTRSKFKKLKVGDKVKLKKSSIKWHEKHSFSTLCRAGQLDEETAEEFFIERLFCLGILKYTATVTKAPYISTEAVELTIKLSNGLKMSYLYGIEELQ